MVLKFSIQNGNQIHIDIPGFLNRNPNSEADLYVDDYYSHKFFDFFIRNPIIPEQQYSRVEKHSMVRIETSEFTGYHVKLEKYGIGEFDNLHTFTERQKQFKGICYKIVSSAIDASGSRHSESSGFDKIWLCEALKDLFNGQHPDVIYMRNLFKGDEDTLNPIDRERYLEFIRADTPIQKKYFGCTTTSILILLTATTLWLFLKVLFLDNV